jgi:predicted RNA-binding Zn-ribbon protein involved in translation (DUF1610 family)
MRNLPNKELQFALKYLKDSLPSKPTAVRGLYSLPKTLDYAFNGPTQQKEAALQKISDHMGHFLGLLHRVNVSFVEKTESGVTTQTVFIANDKGNIGQESKSEYVEEEKYAGLYRVRGYDHRDITIVNDRTFYLIHFLSVLAHEVTHNYLYHHQITAPDEIDSEILTDLAAIFLGFGSTIIHGYEPSSAISCRLGYIDVSTIRRAIFQSYLLRHWKVRDIISQFPWVESHRYYFQLHLFPRAVYEKLFSSQSRVAPKQEANEEIIIQCNSCGQKLRVPKRPVSLKVKCPKCGSSFIIDNNETKI